MFVWNSNVPLWSFNKGKHHISIFIDKVVLQAPAQNELLRRSRKYHPPSCFLTPCGPIWACTHFQESKSAIVWTNISSSILNEGSILEDQHLHSVIRILALFLFKPIQCECLPRDNFLDKDCNLIFLDVYKWPILSSFCLPTPHSSDR